MGWRRLLAVAIVLASASGALALSLSPSSMAPASNPTSPGTNSRVLFAVRNTESVAVTITGWLSGGGMMMMTGIGKPGTGVIPVGPCDLNLPVGLDDSTGPWTLQPGEIHQFKVTPTAPLADGDHSCLYVSQGTAATQASLTLTFHTSATAPIDLQPNAMDFGAQSIGSTETQTFIFANYTAAAGSATATISDPIGNFSLVGCGSATTCTFNVGSNGGTASAAVKCNGNGTSNGTLTITSGVGSATINLYCAAGAGITLDPPSRSLSGPEGTPIMSTLDAAGPGSGSASVSGGNGAVTVSNCTSTPCALPVTLDIVCTPQSSPQTATVIMSGQAGSAQSTVTCASDSAPPTLQLSPSPLDLGSANVGDENTGVLTISNAGGGTLTNVVLSLSGPDSGSFGFDDCGPSSACTVAAGSQKAVTVRFAPNKHGTLQAQLTATADGSGSGSGSSQSTNVAVDGTGIGGVMVVYTPPAPSYHLELGSLPLGQVGSATIELHNPGNATYSASVANASAPYTLSNMTATVDGNGGSASLLVTCSSPTPSPNNDQTWTISSDAYQGAPQDITVSCAIADTNVIVDPLAFDFGEVRKGTSVPAMPLTVTNPGPGSAMLSSMQLRLNRPGLALTPPMTSMSLGSGSVASASLALDTSEDTVLDGEFVDIQVGSATLNLPVRGKVVTPHSRIAPATLDLGTACTGTQAMGDIRLINDGTATLGVDEPEMDTSGSFYAVTTQSTWPAQVSAGAEIVATVMPSPSTTGAANGTLTWHDDSPATYEVAIALEYVSSGTALSPRGLDFGSVAVDGLATSQRVTLENCDPDNHFITVKQLRGIKGPIGAWLIDPAVGFTKQLAPHEQQAVLVTFEPPGRGHYEAELLVETDSGEETIKLVGDATGKDFESTSFYTCGCDAPGVPWQGWPLAFAVLVVSVRRRRGSSSAR